MAARFVLNGTTHVGTVTYTKIDDTTVANDQGQQLLVRGTAFAAHVVAALNAAEPVPVPQPPPPPLPKTITVPSVVSDTFAGATAILSMLGLTASAAPQTGMVGSQSPVAGSVVTVGTVVTLHMVDPTPPPAPDPTPIPVPVTPPGPAPAPSRLALLSDLASWHVGTFKLPAGKFGYSRRGLAYNKLRNSLLISNIDVQAQMSEVSIPTVGGTGTLLAGPVDPTEGKINSIGGDAPAYLGGYWLRADNSLVVSAYDYYDGSGAQSGAFFVRPVDLTNKGHVTGPYPANGAPRAKFASGYFGAIPAGWQAALGGDTLVGMACTNIISASSYGPSVGAMRESDIGVGNQWNPLVYYTQSNPLHNVWNATSDIFNGTSEITGVCFLEGTDTVMFVGRQGTGTYTYGTPGSDAGADPADSNKGNHAYPYRHQVWLYDAKDLAAVHAGAKQPWQVTPYAYGPLGGIPQANDKQQTVGCAYDPATKTLYIAAAFADGDQPLVHVYRLP